MKFLDDFVVEFSTPQAKRAAAVAGLAGGIDYFLNGGNVHALGVACVVYSGVRLIEPYVGGVARRYAEQRKDDAEKM